MKRLWLLTIWVAVLGVTAGACILPRWLSGPAGGTSGTPDESQGRTLDTAGLTEVLADSGANVEMGERISQVFLSVPGQIVHVNGEDVQVYEYPDPAVAEADASQISPDGSSTATTMITWVSTPHFYLSGRLLVLYVGENDDIISLLEQVLGPQFAGG